MKNRHIPLLVKRTTLTPYSLHKTRSQLINDFEAIKLKHVFLSFVYQNNDLCASLLFPCANIKLLRIMNSKYTIGSNSRYVYLYNVSFHYPGSTIPNYLIKYLVIDKKNSRRKGIQMFPSVDSTITESCTKMSLLNKNVSWMQMMEFVSEVIQNTQSKNMETVLFGSIIYKTVTTLGSMVSISDTEDTFIHNCVHNLLSSTFGCDRYFIQEWANRSLEINKSYQPDWCASVKIWKKKYNLIVAEAKPKNKQNRGLVSDFVKLGRELKVMLEEVVKSGAKNPEVFGFLVKGSVLDVYTMDLKTDGIYRFVEIDTLNLVSNYSEMIHLVRTLPLLYQLKERVLSMARRLETVELAKSTGKTVGPSMPLEWFRKSTDPKMAVVT